MPNKKQYKRREKKKIISNLWDFDHHLMEYIRVHIEQLRKRAHSYPNGLNMDLWKSMLSDIEYFCSCYELYVSGRVETSTPDVDVLIPTTDGRGLIRNPAYRGHHYLGIDAIKKFADYERYSRGRKFLLKHFTCLYE